MTRTKKIFLIALTANLVMIGFIYFAAAHNPAIDPTAVTGDMKAFRLLGENIVRHGQFSLSMNAPFFPESFRSPGFPAVLAFLYFFTRSWHVVLFLHACIAALVPVLLYMMLRRWDDRIAYWAALIFALEPNRMWVSATLLSESVFTLFLLGSLYFVTESNSSRRRTIYAGVLVGFAVLTRPVAFFLPILYALYFILTVRPVKESFIRGGILICTSIFIVFPWAYRNHTLFDSWQISSVGSFNMAYYNANEFYRQAHGAYFVEKPSTLEGLSLFHINDFNKITAEVVGKDFLGYVKFHLIKTVPFFLTDGYRDIVRVLGGPIATLPNITGLLLKGSIIELGGALRDNIFATSLLILGSAFWLICLLGLCYAVFDALRGSAGVRWDTLLLVLVVLAFAILSGPVSNARYRVPVSGFLFFFFITLVSHGEDILRGYYKKTT